MKAFNLYVQESETNSVEVNSQSRQTHRFIDLQHSASQVADALQAT